MLKIINIDNTRHRNGEHIQFHAEISAILESYDFVIHKIAELFDKYIICCAQENASLNKTVKNASTADIEHADHCRSHTFRGMADICRAMLNHYESEKADAARCLKVVFDHYGNLAEKPFEEKTAGIYLLIQNMRTNNAQHIQSIGIEGWIDRLEAENNEFQVLFMLRNDEYASKRHLKMRRARTDTDNAYIAIVRKINSLIVVEGADDYVDLVNVINASIEKHVTLIAQREGRARYERKKKIASSAVSL